jgi:alkanesulfonate monooxygenase SsuD/methylene tetrahydromethanopterin reductase-like flavin-dependent oxidoreductase (luciferase family)
MAMKFGVHVSNYDYYADPHRLLDVAEAAAAGGWDGFFIWDHVWFANNKPVCDPWIPLAAVAARFPQLTVGPLITPLPRRRVHRVAREVTTLQAIADDVILGVGIGVDAEYEQFEHRLLDRRERGDQLDADLDLLDELLSGGSDTVRFEPIPQPRPKLWGAARLGSPDRPYRRAGARLDGIVPVRDTYEPGRSVTPEELATVRDRALAHRTSDAPFDVAIISRSLDCEPPSRADLDEAGATWFLEDLHHGGIEPAVALRLLPEGPRV